MIEFVKRQAHDPCDFEPAVFAIYTLLFSKVLFLFADYRRACHNAAADKQQCDPQHSSQTQGILQKPHARFIQSRA